MQFLVDNHVEGYDANLKSTPFPPGTFVGIFHSSAIRPELVVLGTLDCVIELRRET